MTLNSTVPKYAVLRDKEGYIPCAVLSAITRLDAITVKRSEINGNTNFVVLTKTLVEGDQAFMTSSVPLKHLYEITQEMLDDLCNNDEWEGALQLELHAQKALNLKYDKKASSTVLTTSTNIRLLHVRELDSCFVFKGIYGKFVKEGVSSNGITDIRNVTYEVDVVGKHTYWEIGVAEMVKFFGVEFTKSTITSFELACNFDQYSAPLCEADLCEFFESHPKEDASNWFLCTEDMNSAIDDAIVFASRRVTTTARTTATWQKKVKCSGLSKSTAIRAKKEQKIKST